MDCPSLRVLTQVRTSRRAEIREAAFRKLLDYLIYLEREVARLRKGEK